MLTLPLESLSILIETIRRYPQIKKAVIFGSWAVGNPKNGSDVDVAVFGKRLSLDTLIDLKTRLSQTCFPYQLDIVDYHTITHTPLREHIDTVGQVIVGRVPTKPSI